MRLRKIRLSHIFRIVPTCLFRKMRILLVVYDEEGNLELKVEHEENDFAFDEIGSVLKIKQLQQTKRELFESLETFYRVFYLGEE